MAELTKRFSALSTVDQWLLVILGICLSLKLIKGLGSYFYKLFLEHNMGQGKCRFLNDSNRIVRCDNPRYNRSQFEDHGNICNGNNCPGYRVNGINISEIIQTNKILSVLSIICDWGIQLPSVLLIVRTILEVKAQ